jgi:hypothetical protein
MEDKAMKDISGGIYTIIFLVVVTFIGSVAFNYNGFNSIQVKVDRTDTMLTEVMGVERELDEINAMLDEL